MQYMKWFLHQILNLRRFISVCLFTTQKHIFFGAIQTKSSRAISDPQCLDSGL